MTTPMMMMMMMMMIMMMMRVQVDKLWSTVVGSPKVTHRVYRGGIAMSQVSGICST